MSFLLITQVQLIDTLHSRLGGKAHKDLLRARKSALNSENLLLGDRRA